MKTAIVCIIALYIGLMFGLTIAPNPTIQPIEYTVFEDGSIVIMMSDSSQIVTCLPAQPCKE